MRSPNVVLRRACSTDSEGVFPIAQDFATSFDVERDSFTQTFSDLLQDDAAWLGVAEAEGDLIAYLLGFDHLTFFANGRVAWVEEVAVIASWRRQGVAAALMAAFEDWAKGRGARQVALATRRAAPFYSAIGYAESAIYFRRLL